MAKTGICNRKMNKKSIEILRNIEMICFLNKKNINKQKEIILRNISKDNNLKAFIKYLNNFIFKMDSSLYNYEEILNTNTNNNEDNKYLEKIYFTNNIVESLNSKINFYLPKRPTNNADFVNCIIKLITNSNNLNNDIKRHDFVSRTLISLINKFDLNQTPKWIKYNEYIEENKNIINKGKNIKETSELNEIINLINYMDINESENINGNDNISIDNFEEDKKDNIFESDKYENENLNDIFFKESDEGINKFSKNDFNDINKSENNFVLDNKNNSIENFEENENIKLLQKERLKKN